MAQNQDQDLPQRRATYLSLIGVFMGLFAAISASGGRKGTKLELGAQDLALLGLATYRAGRLVAYDRVMEPIRAPVAETKGDSVEPKGSGIQRGLGELLSCPTCVGTWICGGLVYGLQIAPRPTRAVLAVVGASGIAEFLDAATEAFNGTTERSRAEAQQIEGASSGS